MSASPPLSCLDGQRRGTWNRGAVAQDSRLRTPPIESRARYSPLVRPNKVGWVLVVFFAIGGFFFWQTIPEIFIGQIWMGVAALLAVLYLVMTVRANKASKLAATGVRGRADILEMSQTGTYINNQPRVKMRLRIQAPGVIPFETEDTVTVPLIALGALQPGRPLTVVLDPADPKEFVIDWSGNSGGPPITFAMEDGRTANLSGDPATTAAVMQILAKHGIQPGNMDLRGTPHIRNEVLGVIQRAGYFGAAPVPEAAQPGGRVPGMPNSFPPAPGVEALDPAVRLTKLAQLRDAGAITSAEFEEHKRRILSDI